MVKPFRASEAQIQKSILDYLKYEQKVAWYARINTGAVKFDNNRFVKFAFEGCADIIGQLKTGEFLAIEVKRVGEIPTEAQDEFLHKVDSNKGRAGYATSVVEAEHIVKGRLSYAEQRPHVLQRLNKQAYGGLK